MNPQSNEPTNQKNNPAQPDYFPARDGFAAAQAEVQGALGVPVFPYINGRIHDQNTAAWGETGAGGAAKQLKADATTTFASAAAVADAAGEVLDFYNESYGSLANFSVMCPGDATWQRTVAGLVGDVVATGSAGVYIDQASEASRQSKN
jgi:hypothetical protein